MGLALARLASAEPASDLVIGEFPLVRVVDGDTVRVKGLDSSLRLLGIDTEETFKHDKERRAYAKGFAAYAKDVRGASPRPAKFATPLGDEAKRWAEAWFKDVATVRLERDDPHEIKDRYRRYLAYVLAEKHGKWVNYNVEAVRAGMSPYFPKYGRSRRFDRDFIAAEAEAKAAKRGIWAPGAEAYPDYPEREAWWTARGDFVAKFHDEAMRRLQQSSASQHGAGSQRAAMIDLTHDDAVAQLEANAGHDVIALGVVGEIERPGETHRKRGRTRKAHRGEGRTGGSGADARSDDTRGDDARADDDTHAISARGTGARADALAADHGDAYEDGWAGDPDRPDESADEGRADPVQTAARGADVSEARPPDDAGHGKTPTRVILDNHVQLVFFDPDVFAASGISAWKGEWIRVSGTASLYHGRPEIVIDRTGQLELSPVPGLTKPTGARPTKSRNHERSVPIHAP